MVATCEYITQWLIVLGVVLYVRKRNNLVDGDIQLMPLYEYLCDEGHITVRKRGRGNRHIPAFCEECGGKAHLAAERRDHTITSTSCPMED